MKSSSEIMDMLKLAAIASVVAVALIGVSLFALKPQSPAQQYHQSGTVGTMALNALLSVSVNTTQSQLVHVIPESRSVIYNVKDLDGDIDIVAFNANATAAKNLFGISTNRTGDIIVISRMAYPRIEMPNNATVDLIFVNLDSSKRCGFFITTINPSLQQQSNPSILYSLEAAFRGPLLGSFAPVTMEAYTYEANVSLGFFGSDYYMTSCGQNDTYGTLVSSDG